MKRIESIWYYKSLSSRRRGMAKLRFVAGMAFGRFDLEASTFMFYGFTNVFLYDKNSPETKAAIKHYITQAGLI